MVMLRDDREEEVEAEILVRVKGVVVKNLTVGMLRGIRQNGETAGVENCSSLRDQFAIGVVRK